MLNRFYIAVLLFCSVSSASLAQSFNPNDALDYCAKQAKNTADGLTDYTSMPRSIPSGSKNWRKENNREDWTRGFWPGILWYVDEYKKTPYWQHKADSFTRSLTPYAFSKAFDHDLGFLMYCSFGNGYRLTKDTFYKKVLLATADTLATLYNPKVGTILSWPRMVQQKGWPHNTIMDNMINLELLFWAAKNGGSKKLYDIAVNHAFTTMKNHFRKDNTSYHVVIYDTVTGKKIKGITHQGYSDSSMWARGQSWAIYGFTMCYRESKKQAFLDMAQKAADVYLQRLPKDLIPYWDFSAPDIPNAPKDASAAAVTASALLELSTLAKDKIKAKRYREKAEKMLASLSSSQYQSREQNSAFLLHSTGHKPNNSEVDASIVYADYYYIEALIRLKKLKESKSIYQPL